MAKQTIGIGTAANDGTGDPIRTAFDKANDNFDELYAADTTLDGRVTTLEGSPGGVSALDDIGDVNAPAPGDGEALIWDNSAGEWIAAPLPGGGVGGTVPDGGTAGQVLTKASGVDQDIAWATPATVVVGSTATIVSGRLELTGLNLADYSEILIAFEDLTSGSSLGPLVTLSVGGSFIGGTSYQYANRGIAASGSSSSSSSTGTSAFPIMASAVAPTAWETAAGYSFNGQMRIMDPGGTSHQKMARWEGQNGQGSSGANVFIDGAGRLTNTGALDGIRVTGAASLTGGRMTVYGMRRA